MAIYATYEHYITKFFGKAIAEDSFQALALRASREIDQLTFSRAAAIVTADTDSDTIEKIANAACAVAETLSKLDVNDGKVVQSESIGRASVTYFNPTRPADQMFSAARVWLWDTGLLYRGFTEDER